MVYHMKLQCSNLLGTMEIRTLNLTAICIASQLCSSESELIVIQEIVVASYWA